MSVLRRRNWSLARAILASTASQVVYQRLPLTGVAEMGRDRIADWIKDNHRASNARHVAAEDDADAATGRHRQPQWAQVGDVPAAGKSRLGTSGVSRK